MRKISAFNFISLNGFYKGINDDISWNKHTAEESEFSAQSLEAGNVLLFGRVTYQMMERFWTSPQAAVLLPEVAAGMNHAEKIVFSNTLTEANWNNASLVSGDIVAAVTKLKQEEGHDMTILGSGSIITLLTDHGLIDEYQVMIYPVAIAAGTPLFSGAKNPLNLRLTSTRTFNSGSVLLRYVPD